MDEERAKVYATKEAIFYRYDPAALFVIAGKESQGAVAAACYSPLTCTA